MGAATRQMNDLVGNVRRMRRIDCRHRADPGRHSKGCVININGDDIHSHAGGNHDGRQADTATAMHREPVAGPHRSLFDHPAEAVINRQPRLAASA